MQKTLSRWWLLIGTTALAIAGLFALVLVTARTPVLASIPFFSELFHKALVAHVDLSVLVWFLAIACMMWSQLVWSSKGVIPWLEEGALISFALGTLAIAVSPFVPDGDAMMSNYVPVLHNPLFFIGLALVFCGVLLMLGRLLTGYDVAAEFDKPIRFGLQSAGAITVIAFICFFWSYHQMPKAIDGQQYYDLLFWGGGHVLQFTHVQMVMICWLLLARALKSEFHIYPLHLYLLFSIGLVSACLALFIYPFHNVVNWEHRAQFTYLMILCNGVGPTVLALWILPGLITFRAMRFGSQRALWSAHVMSIVLFICGSAIGAMIEEENVIIPAHYHGVIVGITLAFMGLAYLWLPKFGYRNVTSWKLAYWQPIVYGVGQLMHIAGLAYSGGYGVMRKTPGEVHDVAISVKFALGLMGIGGLLAIIGGFMFVVVVGKAVLQKTA